jgi:hypothetical protein
MLGDFLQTHQGSMSWSQIFAIFATFRRKNGRFSQKPMFWSIFSHILALLLVKNADYFHPFFPENI